MTTPSDTSFQTVQIKHADGASLELEVHSLRLRVTSGPDAGDRASFHVPMIRIGTDPDNDLVLTDPKVSRFHACIRMTAEGPLLEDLDSTNGTYLGKIKIREAHLESGSECRLGDTQIQVKEKSERRRSLVTDGAKLGALVGSSPPMRELYALLQAIAPSAATALVLGESGTGKELVARTLHELSGRKGPLIVFDCAATDEAMMRSDLFGHLVGAFTGAARARAGAFREAHGGTLFIDEIGELPLELQPRLLRALENREVTPLGADRAVPVDVRVVAATHRDLPAMVEAGTFRSDLFHRLAVVRVATPPLRERSGDIAGLAEHLARGLSEGTALSAEVLLRLSQYSWPGNVRELRNVLERALAVAGGGPVSVEHLGLGVALTACPGPASSRAPEATAAASVPLTTKQSERALILAALERNYWNQTKAAEELGVSRSTLKRRLKEFQLKP